MAIWSTFYVCTDPILLLGYRDIVSFVETITHHCTVSINCRQCAAVKSTNNYYNIHRLIIIIKLRLHDDSCSHDSRYRDSTIAV